MKILNLATLDYNAAGVACRTVNQMFLQAGHTSVLLVKQSDSKKKDVIALKIETRDTLFKTIKKKINRRLSILYKKINPLKTDPKYAMYNLDERKKHFRGTEILRNVPFKPDVILIFWVSEFVNSKTIQELSDASKAKIFILMTDNAPLTGGCHYPWHCKKFHTDCSDCPGILTVSKKNIPAKNLAFKQKYLPDTVELIAGSESDYQRANSSSLFKGKKIHKLVAPIDQNKFTPGDKEAAKKHFGINSRQKIIFFGAHSLNDTRKGVKYFLEAVTILKSKLTHEAAKVDFIILLAGRSGFEHFRDMGVPVKEVGFLNEEDLIKAYQAASFVVSPSLEDSGPMMVNQSVMCGTPMVAFNTGVAMDLIISGETGYIAKWGDSEDFAEGMKYLLLQDEKAEKDMKVRCRNFALKNISLEFYTESIMSLITKN